MVKMPNELCRLIHDFARPRVGKFKNGQTFDGGYNNIETGTIKLISVSKTRKTAMIQIQVKHNPTMIQRKKIYSFTTNVKGPSIRSYEMIFIRYPEARGEILKINRVDSRHPVH
jgi:hypothetical protein